MMRIGSQTLWQLAFLVKAVEMSLIALNNAFQQDAINPAILSKNLMFLPDHPYNLPPDKANTNYCIVRKSLYFHVMPPFIFRAINALRVDGHE